MSSSQNDVNAALMGQNGENPPTYNSTERTGHSSSMGGTVTLRTSSPLLRSESMTERGRARTVSSIAPMPESCYTISMFLFFLICFQLMNLMTLTYTDSVLNYISKRFRISNTMASFIPSSYQIGNIVVIIPVSFFGHKFNRPRVIAIGVLMMVIGLGCCTLPHFLLLPPPYRNASDTEVCHRYYPFLNNSKQWFASDDTSVSNYQGDAMASIANLGCNANATTYNPAVLLILGHALIGCGSAPIWPLGVSYLDDHVVIRKMPVYLGIFIGTVLLGPVSGFLLGSLTSSSYVELSNPYHMQPTNPAWIGAWWLGYAIAGLLILVLLFPFSFYPARLPVSPQKQAELAEIEILMERKQMSRPQSMLEADARAELESVSVSQSETSSVAGCSGAQHLRECDDSPPGQVISQMAELICAVQRTLSTPLVVTAFVSYIAMSNLLSGVATFGSTYLQEIFSVPRTTSNLLIGGVCVPLGILGTFLGGFIMKKYNFDIRQTLIYTMTMSGIGSLFMTALFALGCENAIIAGLTGPYSDNGTQITNECNMDCGCPKGQFLMVCGSDRVNYLSPCFAGYESASPYFKNMFKKTTVYHNCSCVVDPKKSAVSGACKTTNCVGMLAAYMALVGVGVLLLSLCQAPVYVVLLRVLESKDKSLGIGLMAFLSRILGYIPGPIWFGLILDRSCIYWSGKCLGKSTCLLYNNLGLRLSFTGLCVACAFAYCLVFSLSFLWMEFHKDQYEKSFPVSRNGYNETEDDTANNAFWK